MGEALGVLGALECQSCCSDLNRYVLNALHFKSKCSDCCDCSLDTDPIALVDDDEVSVEAEDGRWHAHLPHLK